MFSNLEIQLTVRLAFYIAVFLAVILVPFGVGQIAAGRKLPYYKKRNDKVLAGWRMIFSAVFIGILALLINSYAEPVIYTYFAPSPTKKVTPTVTLTPTITETPTITQTPTITLTPLFSYTPTITPIPVVPLAVEAGFTSVVTPDPASVFSPLQFARNLDVDYLPINPQNTFINPIKHLYGVFSYDGMVERTQFTALWYRDAELVNIDSFVWDGGTGGYGYTDWGPDPGLWLPGEYEVQIFNGVFFKVSGRFTVTGDPPTPRPTATSTFTATLTPLPTNTYTLIPTKTPRPTSTPVPTKTPRPTSTPVPTNMPRPTNTATLIRTPTNTTSITPAITVTPTR